MLCAKSSESTSERHPHSTGMQLPGAATCPTIYPPLSNYLRPEASRASRSVVERERAGYSGTGVPASGAGGRGLVGSARGPYTKAG